MKPEKSRLLLNKSFDNDLEEINWRKLAARGKGAAAQAKGAVSNVGAFMRDEGQPIDLRLAKAAAEARHLLKKFYGDMANIVNRLRDNYLDLFPPGDNIEMDERFKQVRHALVNAIVRSIEIGNEVKDNWELLQKNEKSPRQQRKAGVMTKKAKQPSQNQIKTQKEVPSSERPTRRELVPNPLSEEQLRQIVMEALELDEGWREMLAGLRGIGGAATKHAKAGVQKKTQAVKKSLQKHYQAAYSKKRQEEQIKAAAKNLGFIEQGLTHVAHKIAEFMRTYEDTLDVAEMRDVQMSLQRAKSAVASMKDELVPEETEPMEAPKSAPAQISKSAGAGAGFENDPRIKRSMSHRQ